MKKWLTILTVVAAVVSRSPGFAAVSDEERQFRLICAMCSANPDPGAIASECAKFQKMYPHSKHAVEVEYIYGRSLGNTPEAISVLKRVLGGSKRMGISAEYLIGQVYYNLKQYPKALSTLSDIVAHDPKDFIGRDSLFGIVQAQIALNTFSDAQDTLSKLSAADHFFAKQENVQLIDGLLLYRQKKYPEALERLESIKSAESLYYQAKCMYQMGEYLQAVVTFRSLISQNPDTSLNEEVNLLIAECFYRSNDFISATEEYKKFVIQYPLSAFKEDALYKVGCCYFQKQLYPEAIAAFNDLIKDYPAKEFAPTAQFMIGESYLAQNDLPNAINAYGQVISGYPNSDVLPDAYYKLGWCYTKQGSDDPAIGILTQFITRFPKHDYLPYALILQAMNYHISKNEEQEINCYKRVLDCTDRSTELTEVALFMITKTYYDMKKYNDIISNYHYILKNQIPSRSEWRSYTYLLVGEAYYYLGLYTESEKVYDLIMKNFPYSTAASLAQDGQAWAHSQLKEYALAEKERQSFLDDLTVEHSSATTISNEYEMGNIYYNQKKFVEALDVFEKFIVKYPQDALVPEALYSIGRCQYKLEYYSKAIQTWETMVTSFPQCSRVKEAMNLIADTYFRAQKYTEAVQAYQAIVAKYPGDDGARQAQLRIAQSYYNAGDDKKAFEEFETFLNTYPEDVIMGENALEGIMMASYRMGESGKGDGIDEKALAKFIEKYPKSKLASNIQYRLAERYYQKKDFVNAAEEFRKVFSNFSEGAHIIDAYFFNAESYYYAANYPEAINAYKRFTTNFPTHASLRPALLHLANSIYYTQDYLKAAEVYQQLTKTGRTDDEIAVTALVNTALCFKKANKWEEAALVYEQFVKTYPKHDLVKDTLTDLAGIYEILKQYEQAAIVYKELLLKLPEKDLKINEIQYKIGDSLVKEKKIDQAIIELKKLTALGPANDMWRLSGLAQLAQVYETQKNWKEATIAYEEITHSTSDPQWVNAAQDRIKALKSEQPSGTNK